MKINFVRIQMKFIFLFFVAFIFVVGLVRRYVFPLVFSLSLIFFLPSISSAWHWCGEYFGTGYCLGERFPDSAPVIGECTNSLYYTGGGAGPQYRCLFPADHPTSCVNLMNTHVCYYKPETNPSGSCQLQLYPDDGDWTLPSVSPECSNCIEGSGCHNCYQYVQTISYRIECTSFPSDTPCIGNCPCKNCPLGTVPVVISGVCSCKEPNYDCSQVNCPDGYICDPSTGSCVRYLCPGNQIYLAASGSCGCPDVPGWHINYVTNQCFFDASRVISSHGVHQDSKGGREKRKFYSGRGGYDTKDN